MAMQKKTVLITGTSSGIGLETARLFYKNGWNVIATLRSPGTVKRLNELTDVFQTELDVTNQDSIEKAIRMGIEKFGGIDVVINNAGYGLFGSFEETSTEELRGQFETNYFGPLNVIRAVLPHLRERKQGTILNVTSMGGRSAMPLYSSYHGSKFALEGFTESLQYELKPFNIQMKLVEPGGVKTDFSGRSAKVTKLSRESVYFDYQNNFYKRLMELAAKSGSDPVDTAKVIYKAATDNCSRLRYVAGSDARMFAFLNWILPHSLFRKIVANMAS